MIGVSFKIKKKPPVKMDLEDRTLWRGVALDSKKAIIKRTRSGVDVKGVSFKAYDPEYARAKAEGKVSIPGGGRYGARGAGAVNLTLSGKMLNSIGKRVTEKSAFLVLSGFEGFKAYANELYGRVFFDISKKEADKVVKRVADFFSKKNKLKKR